MLGEIVEKVSTLARSGDMKAIEFITDRLDGKVAQTIDVAGSLDYNRRSTIVESFPNEETDVAQ